MLPRQARESLEQLWRLCDATSVVIYGPYAPSKGRTRWRLQVYDQTTGRKKSVTAESRAAAEALIPLVEEQLRRQDSLGPGLHDAIAQYLAHKASVAGPLWVKTLGERLRAFLPDVPVSQLTPQQAAALYLKETQRIGKFGVVSAATHHATLRNAKEFFRWLCKRELARGNPFEKVDPIGRASAGKPQPRETDARKLDALLFAQARAGDEGSLALLMQIYLGLRSDEVLSLHVSAVEREGHKITIVRGKTRNARRSLEVYPELAALLWAHCAGRPESERVFAANLPKKPKPDWMYKRLHKRCAELGLPKFCPHSLYTKTEFFPREYRDLAASGNGVGMG